MDNFKNALIYKICYKDDSIEEHYIGSTCNLTRRSYEHHNNCVNDNNKEHNSPVYMFIRANGGWDNWRIEKLADVHCDNKHDLKLIEKQYIKNGKKLLNKNVPLRKWAEYYQDNKVKILAQKKQYVEDNRDMLNEKRRKNYKGDSSSSKQYYEKNKEKILAKHRIRYWNEKMVESANIIMEAEELLQILNQGTLSPPDSLD